MSASPERSHPRRSFLAGLVTGVVGLIGAGLAGLVGLVAAPKSTGSNRRWRRAAASTDVPANQPMSVVIAERHADGWYDTRRESVVFIDRDGEGYRVLSATCQHLGCRVRWDNTKHQFLCPCHGGVYDRQGTVVAGPPPRGLQRLTARVNEQTGDIEVEL